MFRPDPIPADLAEALSRVRPRLGALASTVLYFNDVGSTNDVAARLAQHGDAEGAVVIAAAQSAGRGRHGRTWFSPPGAGLYVSVVLSPIRAECAPERATALLTISAGVALAEAVERATGLQPAIKWPNDLLVGRRKLAGILAEGMGTTSGGSGVQAVVLGYGLNVSTAAYPPELADRVTSLELELGRGVESAVVCAESLASLAARYEDLLAARFGAILDAWRRRAFGASGARVSWDTLGGTHAGTTAGIDDDGALLVHTAHGLERVVAGAVRWD